MRRSKKYAYTQTVGVITESRIQAGNPTLRVALVIFVLESPQAVRETVAPIESRSRINIRVGYNNFREEIVRLQGNQNTMTARIVVVGENPDQDFPGRKILSFGGNQLAK